jgi:hypothetical protein
LVAKGKEMKKTLLLAICASVSMLADSNWNAGKNIGNSTLNYFKSDLSGTINKPITTDQKLKTVDGSKEGDVKLLCAEGSTKEFLEIGYSGNSDITISVQLDKNLDGEKETNYSFSGISGVCSNGVIKCSLGTWNNCKVYKWTYNSNTLNLSQSTSEYVSGCYCINSSCGSLAATEKKNIIADISGAISPLISNSSEYIITKAENNGETVKYWGQDYSNCSSSYGSKPNISLDGSNMQSATDSAIISGANDDKSAYYILNEGAGNNMTLDSTYKSSLTSRTTTIRSSSVNPSGNDYAYSDSLNGSIVNVSGTLLLGSNEEAKYCEVEWSVNNTDVFDDGTNRANSTNSNKSKLSEIRECTDNWTNCPINEGESIKHQCGAIDNFVEVTGALNAVSEATKDMVCSTK